MSRRHIDEGFRVLGIDPSFTCTGLVILSPRCVIYQNDVVTPSKENIIARVFTIMDTIDWAIEYYKPTICVIEGMAFSAKGKSVMDTGYLGYRLRERIQWENGHPLIEPAPTAVKKFATGQGNCGKELILQQVYKRWGIEYHNNNLADAYVLAQIGMAFLQQEDEKLPKFQQEVLKVIRKEVPWYGK